MSRMDGPVFRPRRIKQRGARTISDLNERPLPALVRRKANPRRSVLGASQQAVLDFVRSCDYSPTIREIGEAVGLSSSSTVFMHLQRLREFGLLRPATKFKPRSIVAVTEGEPVVKLLLTYEERRAVDEARASLQAMPSYHTAAMLAIIDRLSAGR